MTINDISEKDEGLYRCEANNGVEEAITADTRLTVYGKRVRKEIPWISAF